MSEIKHTSGPWNVTKSACYTGHGVSAGRKRICSINSNSALPKPERDDNAHLIAGAPDLKAFADSILIHTVEGDENHIWLKFGSAGIVVHHIASAEGIALLKMEAARKAAVAKATGAAP